MTHPYFQNATYPRVLAHRGLTSPGVWENTAASFAAAHAAGVEYVETDCRLTKDGQVVLFHDETLQRLLDDSRKVSEVTTAELADMLSPFGGLLTVPQALEAFPTLRFNIDVKSDATAAPLGRAIAAHTHRVLVTSFSDRRRERAIDAAIQHGARIRPAASAGQSRVARLLLASTLRLRTGKILHKIDALQIPERFGPVRVLTRALLRAAHTAGAEVHVWTINDPARMQRLVRFGVDGIVSDRADLARRSIRTPPRI